MTVIQELTDQHFHFTPGWVKWMSPEEANTLSEATGVSIRRSATVEDFQRQVWNHLDNEFSVSELLALKSAPRKWLQASWARPGAGGAGSPGDVTAADVKAIAAAVDAALSDNFAAVLAAVAGADEATLATFGLKRA